MIKLPTSWLEVSFVTYLELLEVDSNEETPFFTKSLEKLCILSESDDWEDETSTTIYTAIKENEWLLSRPDSKLTESFDDWNLKPYMKYTLAEWIDLDKFISTQSYEKIVALAYRRTNKDEWGNTIYEPYQFKCSERANEFMEVPVNTVFGSIEGAIKFRANVLDKFSKLFGSLEDENFEETEEDRQYLTPNEIEEQREEIKKDNVKRKYAWESLLDGVSGGDWSRVEAILELPAVFVFNMMAMKEVYADKS
jgi:hypothetical protein